VSVSRLVAILSVVLFYALFLGKSILLYWKDGINPFVLGKDKGKVNAMIERLFPAGLLYWTIEVLGVCLGLPALLWPKAAFSITTDNTALKTTGMIVLALGFALFLSALISFGRSWRVGIDKKTHGEFVTRGVFQFTRNPIFVFIDLLFIGIWMVLGNLFFLLAALIAVAVMDYQIRQEEEYLSGLYGESYRLYRAKVNRYVGGRL